MADERDRAVTRWVLAALGCFLFVVLAVVVEVMAGSRANSPAPSWVDRIVPLAWPQRVRVLWWLGVAGAAGGFRLALHRLGFRQRRLMVVLSVAPFVVFAAGVAVGADWATWH